MKQSQRFARIASIIIRKDWREFRKPMLALGAGMGLPVLMILSGRGRADLARGLLMGTTVAAPFFYAQSCFYIERQRGTLDLLLSLPLSRLELVLAKFASVFSMTLVTINIPTLLLRDVSLLLHANAAALFLACFFMSAAVITDKPWAPQIPFLLVVLLTMTHPGNVDAVAWISSHTNVAATDALAVTPLLTAVSAWVFSRK
jgi:hypothetical protein